MHDIVEECEENAKSKGEGMQESGGMRREIISIFSVGGEASMFVSTTSSRHMGMIDTLLEREVTEGECTTMISGLRSQISTFPILIGVIHMIGYVRPNASSISKCAKGGKSWSC